MAKRILRSLRLDKIAAVDRPCQEHATVAIIKRDYSADDRKAMADKGQALPDGSFPIANVADLKNAIQSIGRAKDLAAAKKHIKARAKALDAMDELPDDWMSKGIDTDELAEAVAAAVAEHLSKQETTDMTITTLAALKAAIAKFDPTKSTVAERDEIHEAATTLKAEKELPAAGPLAKAAPAPELAEALAEIAKMKAVADLTPAEKAEYDKLDAAGKKAFLAKSAPERAAEREAIEKGDPVAYTMKDGTIVRKSAGDVAVMMAKALDAQAAQMTGLVETIKGLTEKDVENSIAKRAAEFKHLPNATSIIKAHDALPEADRAGYLETMRAADKAASGAFKSVGSSMVPNGDEGDDTPLGKMAAIVKRIATEEKISEPQATIKAVNDPEYKAAYAESVRKVRTA